MHQLRWEDQVSRSNAGSNTCFIVNNSIAVLTLCALRRLLACDEPVGQRCC